MVTEVLNYLETIQQQHVDLNHLILTHNTSLPQDYNELKGAYLQIEPLQGVIKGALDMPMDLEFRLNLIVSSQFSNGDDVNIVDQGFHLALEKSLGICTDILSRIEKDIIEQSCPIKNLTLPASFQCLEAKTKTWAAVVLGITYTIQNQVNYNAEKWQ